MEVHGTPYVLRSCTSCRVIFACADGEATFDYSDYGDYLVAADGDRIIRGYEKSYGALLDSLIDEYGKEIVLLDVGAGCGMFMKFCMSKGVMARGVEPSAKLREFALHTFGLSISEDIQHVDDQSIDIVTCLDVIEHVEPAKQSAFMKQIDRVLKKGGILLGNTPNINSLNILVARDRDPVIWPPSHQVYFSPATLDYYLKSLNYTQKFCYTRGFAPFRTNKTVKSFVEVPKGNLARFVAFPLKVLIKLTGVMLRYTKFGHQIYFCYGK
jgi:SAM-dependent methyltransferase